MISVDLVVFFVVLSAMVAGIAWYLALPERQRLAGSGSLEERVRCALCASADECERRRAAGAGPVANCPIAGMARAPRA